MGGSQSEKVGGKMRKQDNSEECGEGGVGGGGGEGGTSHVCTMIVL